MTQARKVLDKINNEALDLEKEAGKSAKPAMKGAEKLLKAMKELKNLKSSGAQVMKNKDSKALISMAKEIGKIASKL